MGILTPNLDILRESQQQLWKQLGSTPVDFVLYGGTALALRLGHRESIDFDFFSSRSFQPFDLVRSVPYLLNQTITQQSESTLSCDISTAQGTVKISFFGGLSLGQIQPPDRVESNDIVVASLIDIFGTKCATIFQRNEIKDYLDIHALITDGKIDLAIGIAAARAIYGHRYNPVLTLQALSYFDDLPDPLPQGVRVDLLAAVRSVSLQNLPTLTAPRKIGEDTGRA
jgi:hypothetical protein